MASIAAAAAAASSVGVKPQAEAPHSAPVAPRNALRRRLRRRTCTARARAQRHRSVLQARAGPTWEYERSSSVARGLQGARRRGRAGRWQTERFSGAALPSNAPGAGRSKAEARAHAPAAAQTTKKPTPLHGHGKFSSNLLETYADHMIYFWEIHFRKSRTSQPPFHDSSRQVKSKGSFRNLMTEKNLRFLSRVIERR